MLYMLRRFPLLSGKTTRAVYFLTGVILFTIKYTIDWLVASQVFNREWSPLRYLFWPDRETVQIHRLAPDDQSFALTLLLIALPFILIGVALTIRRIRDAGLPLAFVLFFFIPVVNLTLILLLCLAPSAWTTPLNETPAELNRARAIHHRIAGKSDRAAFLLACLASASTRP